MGKFIVIDGKEFCSKGHKITETSVRTCMDGGKIRRRCKLCFDVKLKKYHQSEKGKLASKRAHFRFNYGIELEDRQKLLDSQEGKCLICGTTDCSWDKKGIDGCWHIDHNHDTKKVRGVLCGNCNVLLGKLEKIGLHKFVDYLEKL